jgi:hypothetical protein
LPDSTAQQIPATALAAAAAAATAVFDRALKLMAPNPVFVNEAIAAAAAALLAHLDEPAPLADRHRLLRNALADVVSTTGLALPAEDRIRAIKDRAVTALSADLP